MVLTIFVFIYVLYNYYQQNNKAKIIKLLSFIKDILFDIDVKYEISN